MRCLFAVQPEGIISCETTGMFLVFKINDRLFT